MHLADLSESPTGFILHENVPTKYMAQFWTSRRNADVQKEATESINLRHFHSVRVEVRETESFAKNGWCTFLRSKKRDSVLVLGFAVTSYKAQARGVNVRVAWVYPLELVATLDV